MGESNRSGNTPSAYERCLSRSPPPRTRLANQSAPTRRARYAGAFCTPYWPGAVACGLSPVAYPQGMADYTPPLLAIKFVLRHIACLDELIHYPGFDHVNPETLASAPDFAGQLSA